MSAENPRRRGTVRIYLGIAPGVGKTFAMLSEACRRAESGTDVVVGVVATHGRPAITSLLDGLELIPPRPGACEAGGTGELDVDAVFARRPTLVVVDECAHPNVLGAVNAYRWQDIDQLVAAGIDVLSTLNIGQVESLSDVAAAITGVDGAETVPDAWLRAIGQIELVDITPEALLRRMAHGSVCRPEQLDAGLANRFKPANLAALRELALRWLADEVGGARRAQYAGHGEGWDTRERIVVALRGGPSGQDLIRRAARIAARTPGIHQRADLLCVHVLPRHSASASATSVNALRRLAESVGASFHTVSGADVAAALLEFARGAHATQLVLGTSPPTRPATLLGGGIASRVARTAGPIDVHLVARPDTRASRTPHHRRRTSLLGALPRSRVMAGWVSAVVAPALATLAGVLGSALYGLSTDVVLFFAAVVAVAMIGGLGPALGAVVLGGLELNYFLTPPLHTFTIAARENEITLVAMLAVAVSVALVVNRAARRGEQAARSGAEANLLASLSRGVLTNTDPLPQLLEQVRRTFALRGVALVERAPDEDTGWRTISRAGPLDQRHRDDVEVDVAVNPDIHLLAEGRTLAAGDRRVLESVGAQALVALRGQRIAAEAAQARRAADGAALRSALLSAVGHDLRTPLTSIKAAAGSLRDTTLALSTTDRGELLATVEESADRLTALVNNLLDSSRLAAGAVVPRLDFVGFDEVVCLALVGLHGAERVALDVDETLPAVSADAGLLERVVANLVDNALRHGQGAPVRVRASAHAGRVELRVIDAGPGVPAEALDGLFVPFQRLGDRDMSTGVGLGLAVARGFTEAMGGTLSAEHTPGGGLTMVISLQAAGAPDAVTAVSTRGSLGHAGE
jgi:two-component system sensor histidine kinase KdpD